MRSFAKNILWLFLDKVFRFAVTLAISALLARSMGPSQWGLFNYTSALIVIFSFFSMLGIDQWVVSELVSDGDRRGHLLASILAIRAIGAVAATVAAVALVKIRAGDPNLKFLLFGIGAVFGYALDFPDLHFQSLNQSKYSVFARATGFLAANAMRALGVFLGFGMAFFVATIVMETAVSGIAQYASFRLVAKQKLRFDELGKNMRFVLENSWPLLASSALVLLYTKLDQVFVTNLVSAKDSGIYVAGQRILDYLNVFPMIFSISALPLIIPLFRGTNQRQESGNVSLLIGSANAASWLTALFIYAGAPWIIRWIYGPQYDLSIEVLRIVIWCYPLLFFGVIRQGMLLSKRKLSVGLALEAATLGLMVAFQLFFTPRFGARGAAFALVATSYSVNLLSLLFSRTIRSIFSFYFGSMWHCRTIRASVVKKCVESLVTSKQTP